MSVKSEQLRTAIIVENQYQKLEAWYPIYRLREAGIDISCIGPEKGAYRSKLGYVATEAVDFTKAAGSEFDLIVFLGGYAPDLMRNERNLIDIIHNQCARGTIIAAILPGSWLLASADVIRGKKVTGAPSIKDDLLNAGGVFQDSAAVADRNIISSRRRDVIPAFSSAIFNALAESAFVIGSLTATSLQGGENEQCTPPC